MMRRIGVLCLVTLVVACGGSSDATPTSLPPATVAPAEPTAPPILPTPPPPTPTTAATPTVAPQAFRVGNTGGDGLFLRREPGTAPEDRIRAWPDGTLFEGLGERQEADGVMWEKVRDPDGAVGYAAAQYLVPQTASGATPAGATATGVPGD